MQQQRHTHEHQARQWVTGGPFARRRLTAFNCVPVEKRKLCTSAPFQWLLFKIPFFSRYVLLHAARYQDAAYHPE